MAKGKMLIVSELHNTGYLILLEIYLFLKDFVILRNVNKSFNKYTIKKV